MFWTARPFAACANVTEHKPKMQPMLHGRSAAAAECSGAPAVARFPNGRHDAAGIRRRAFDAPSWGTSVEVSSLTSSILFGLHFIY